MLFFIFIAILTAGAIIWHYVDKRCSYTDAWTSAIAFLISVGFVTVTLSLFVIFGMHLLSDVTHENLKLERTSLVYQYENDLYENDNDYGKKELMNDIQSFNKKVAGRRQMQRNFWIGVYIPNIYDDISLIGLGK